MFIKIFHGKSQQYTLQQVNDVILDKTARLITSDAYYILCKYLDLVNSEQQYADIGKCDEYFNQLKDSFKKEREQDIREYMADTFPNIPEQLICPLLSPEEERIIRYNCEPSGCCNEELSTIWIDDKLYITTGSIFVMNDDGKTIDRI